MKKTVLILVMLALATGVFAQKISLDGHLSTFVYHPWIERGIVAPSVGVVVDLGFLDILGNIELMIERDKTTFGSDNEREINTSFGFYAGVAPKVSPVDRLTLSFPCFFKFYLIGTSFKYSSTPNDDVTKRATVGAFGFDAGARLTYAFNQKWSVYTGANAELFSFFGKGRVTNYGGKKSDAGSTTKTFWFDAGSIDLGIKYTFN